MTSRLAFSPTQRVLHWLMAICIIGMLFVGVAIASTASPDYPALVTSHKTLGILLLLLVLLRIAARLRNGAPPLPADLPAPMKLGARLSHLAFYGLMLAMPLIGWAMVSAEGYPIVLAGGLRLPPIVPALLFLCGATVLLLAVACFAQVLSWARTWPAFVPFLLMQAALCGPLFSRVRDRLNTLRRLSNEVSVLQQGLLLMQAQQFTSPKLKALVDSVLATNASQNLLWLDRLLRGIVERDKDFFALPSIFTASGTQLVLAVERWRSRYRGQFGVWIDTWAEFDALQAIACYAWEHPNDVFPAIDAGATAIQLQGMAHPLLPAEKCVRNDVVLDESRRFWVLSGSNMAGKSTLLRAIGMNLVLAYAGAPICAASAQCSLFSIGASISLSDSLLDGTSKFLAEAARLREILRAAGGGRPVLFLVDEILSGTNSSDRFTACKAVVRALIASGAVGIFSTHDLLLTSIADESRLKGLKFCMESGDPSEPLSFDYLVKSGLSRRSSAIAIIRLLGMDAGAD